MRTLTNNLSILFTILLLSGCARDLSSSTYVSSSTLNIVLSGRVVAAREVKVKESDRLQDNTAGAAIGAVGAGAAAHSISGGQAAPVVAGAIVGGLAGAVVQDALSSSKGIEYIVKVDTSKLSNDYYEGSPAMRNSLAAAKASGIITVVQAKEKKQSPLHEGQKVLVIISENRTRVVADDSN